MIKGSIVALVTPMHKDGSLDEAALDSLIEWHLDSGTHGFVVGGTTGEASALSQAELVYLVEKPTRKQHT